MGARGDDQPEPLRPAHRRAQARLRQVRPAVEDLPEADRQTDHAEKQRQRRGQPAERGRCGEQQPTGQQRRQDGREQRRPGLAGDALTIAVVALEAGGDRRDVRRHVMVDDEMKHVAAGVGERPGAEHDQRREPPGRPRQHPQPQRRPLQAGDGPEREQPAVEHGRVLRCGVLRRLGRRWRAAPRRAAGPASGVSRFGLSRAGSARSLRAGRIGRSCPVGRVQPVRRSNMPGSSGRPLSRRASCCRRWSAPSARCASAIACSSSMFSI